MATATQNEQRLDQLKQKYASVLNMIQQSGVRLERKPPAAKPIR
jgi:hypothetical protein